MGAEALREVAVVVLVFGLLDRYMSDRAPPGWSPVVVLVAVATFVAGGVLERARRT